MAKKNTKGQKVTNKKYYKKSTTSTKKKKNTRVASNKKTTTNKRTYNKNPKKLENNVAIKVDDTKETLNYNILEEPIETTEEEKEEKTTYNADRKIKTNFKDEEQELEDTKFLAVEDIKEAEKEYTDEPEEEIKEEIEENKEKEETEKYSAIEPVYEEEQKEEEPIIVEEIKEEIIEEPIETTEEVQEEAPTEEEPTKIEITKEEKIEATNIKPEELDKYILHNTQELKVIHEDSGIFNNEDVDLPDDVKRSSSKGYIKFVIILVVLFLLIIACIYSIISFSMKYIDSNGVNNIAYHEISSIDYQVCDNNCISTNQINKKNKSVKAKYSYEMDFDEKITYEANFTIVAELNIIDPKNNNIIATDKSIIIKKDINDKDTANLNLSQSIEIELNKYRDKLKDYNYNNKTNNAGLLEVVMYVDGINDKERVSSLSIPMDKGEIDTEEISYNAGDASLENSKVTSNKTYLYLIIGSFVVLFASCIGVLILLHSSNDTYEN